MRRQYYRKIIEISKNIIKCADEFHKENNLLEAAYIIQKAEEVFMPELKQKPKNQSLINLKQDYDKKYNEIISSMTKAMENKFLIKNTN